jgi:cytochrome c peroxidase|nr:cytochrome c peroxidase [Kofleriaceae bacterium]
MRIWWLALTVVVASAACAACGDDEDIPDFGPAPVRSPHATGGPADAATSLNPRLLRRFRPLPEPPAGTDAVVALGKQLFYDPRLSKHGDVACNTCHPLAEFGADHATTSRGNEGQRGPRNAPTVLNAGLQAAQFWDGRAASLTEQVRGPLFNPVEMALAGPDQLVAALAKAGYRPVFAAAFPGDRDAMSFDHAALALASFERTLLTPARWDQFLDGDAGALTAPEIAGAKLFADIGCVQCHTGTLVGGSMFQKVGVAEVWPDQDDQGRYQVTHLDADRMVFKVPSLRNVTRTAPYFHDGRAKELPDAIRMMGRYQVGVELTDDEIVSIARWLATLESPLPATVTTPPALPR